jgi:23S rRNA (cytosine1962-C5)-methyltransferase
MRATIAEVATMPDTPAAALLPALRLKRNEDRRLHGGHLWVFSNEIDTQQTPLNKFAAGDLVRVLAHNDRALGLAYVNPASLISARLLSTWQMPTAQWLEERLRHALVIRQRLHPAPYYRWVYGESDALPGLVVDRFGDTCVVQISTAGMERLKPQILQAIEAVASPHSVLFKNDGSVREMEGLPLYLEWAKGKLQGPASVVEDTMQFWAPLEEGQKTGWYFDQTANRRALTRYLRKGARVLDAFCYLGAWGVRAAVSGASQVICVDGSAVALEWAAKNAARNGVEIQTTKGDAFTVLAALADQGAKFDIVIVDPPAFAKRKKDHAIALAAYKRINQLAMRLLADEGILVSCSCSYHVSNEELQDVLGKAARGAARSVQILETGGQSADHPVHPAIPETRYLKAFYCRVTAAMPC